MTIYLASKSPRRQELLQQMGVSYELLWVDTPEEVRPGESADHYSNRVTREKLEAAWLKLMEEQLPDLPILCADTEVVLDGVILGKPANAQAAFNMLLSLSGRSHEVITSVGLQFGDYQKILQQKTLVTFDHMPQEAIHQYVATGNYAGKSGGYGIQSAIGQFISHIDGCFYSVMGLSLHATRLLLAEVAILR